LAQQLQGQRENNAFVAKEIDRSKIAKSIRNCRATHTHKTQGLSKKAELLA